MRKVKKKEKEAGEGTSDRRRDTVSTVHRYAVQDCNCSVRRCGLFPPCDRFHGGHRQIIPPLHVHHRVMLSERLRRFFSFPLHPQTS